MNYTPDSFFIFLSILWFLIYWILGGVFFAVLTLLRLGRVRKARFSCLFSLLALGCGIGASYWGLQTGRSSIEACVASAESRIEMITAVFGCGFAGVFGAFLLGAAVLVLGGFVLMLLSKSKSKPWIILEEPDEVEDEESTHENASKFF